MCRQTDHKSSQQRGSKAVSMRASVILRNSTYALTLMENKDTTVKKTGGEDVKNVAVIYV